ncbi:MAG: hypothetical protein AAGA56_21865 [Myxococcota bacterium]
MSGTISFLSAGCVLPEVELGRQTDLCFECVQVQCEEESIACVTDTACEAALSCVQACDITTEDCVGGCASEDAVALATPLLECGSTRCPDDCAGLIGG